MAPKFFSDAKQVLEILRVHAQVPLLAGCSSQGLIVGEEEVEQNAGLSLALYALPGADLQAFHFTQEQVEEANGPGYWRLETGIEPEQTNGWLVFIDPFHLDSETWLRTWNEAYAPLPVLGGLASGDFTEQRTQVYLNGEVFEEGGVAISVGGDVKLAGVTSQGCTPIGETWTLTKVEQNIIHEIGNRPGLRGAGRNLQQLIGRRAKDGARQSVHRPGRQRIPGRISSRRFSDSQFAGRRSAIRQHRGGRAAAARADDAISAAVGERGDRRHERIAWRGRRSRLGDATIYGGCLCSCNGRGQNLFGQPNHDAQMVQQRLGPLGLAGFFCNGEIGPVGEKNFLHGYTASLALFVKK